MVFIPYRLPTYRHKRHQCYFHVSRIHVDKAPGMVLFVAADDSTGAGVNAAEPSRQGDAPALCQRSSGHRELAGDPDWPEAFPLAQYPDLYSEVGAGPVRSRWNLPDRFCIPASSIAAQRSARHLAVGHDTWKDTMG